MFYFVEDGDIICLVCRRRGYMELVMRSGSNLLLMMWKILEMVYYFLLILNLNCFFLLFCILFVLCGFFLYVELEK